MGCSSSAWPARIPSVRSKKITFEARIPTGAGAWAGAGTTGFWVDEMITFADLDGRKTFLGADEKHLPIPTVSSLQDFVCPPDAKP